MQLPFSNLTKLIAECNYQFLRPNFRIPKSLQPSYDTLISKICAINLQIKKINQNSLFNIDQVNKKQLGFQPPPDRPLNIKPPFPYTNFLNKNQHINGFFKKTRMAFTKDEDEKIKELVHKYGCRQWKLISSFIPGRSPKQCRDRYSNYLIPGLKRGQWIPSEDELLTKLYINLGPKWSVMQKYFPGRSTSSIKNRWNYFLCRQNNDKVSKNESQLNEINVLNEDCIENDNLNFTDYLQLDEISFLALQSQNQLDEISVNNENEDSYNYIDQVSEILKNIENENDDDWIII